MSGVDICGERGPKSSTRQNAMARKAKVRCSRTKATRIVQVVVVILGTLKSKCIDEHNPRVPAGSITC